MKKFTALLLILATMTGCLVTGCENRRDRDRRDRDREEEEEDDDEEEDEDDDDRVIATSSSAAATPQYLTDPVQETRSFGDYDAVAPDTPWVLENNIPFYTGPVIDTYFNQFVTDYNLTAEIPTTIYNNVATITRPSVRHYPAQEPGYTVYEITYTETIPARALIPQVTSYNTIWSYHGVSYLDYYTGMVYPTIELSTDTDSYCISGNINYNGQTYTVYHYAYRVSDFPTNEITSDSNGNSIWEITNVVTITDYFIVPNGYDGIVMFIYTADDSDESFEELMAYNTPFYTEPHLFGEPGFDETIEEHTFLSIAALG